MNNDLFGTRRYLAAYLPLLSAERLIRQRGIAPDPPFALIEKQKGALVLAACDKAALALGLVPGLPLADARARVPELSAFPHDPNADRALLHWLADGCGRYTPMVAVHPPATIILDITGATHFYGDESAMKADLRARLKREKLTGRVALGATPDSARAFARFGCNDIQSLPVEALDMKPAVAAALRRAGLATIGHLSIRPRTALAARFGKLCTIRLARLLEEEDPHIVPLRALPTILTERRFAEPLAHSEMALMVLVQLAVEAAITLAQRGEGGRRFEASLFRSDGHVARLTVESGAATRDPKLLDRLFRERIGALADPLDPGFGYDMIALAISNTEPLPDTQIEMDGPPNFKRNWRALVDQLSIRLGNHRVRHFYSRESHIPERVAFTKAAAAAEPGGQWPSPDPAEPPLRPLTLFDPPQAIEVTAGFPDGEPRSFCWHRRVHRVARAEGPERIGSEWWRHERGYELGNGGLTRDYYRVEDKEGCRFWLFRRVLYEETERPSWYLHGLFA